MSENNIPFVIGQKVVDKELPSEIAIFTGKSSKIGSKQMIELRYPNGQLRRRPLSSIVVIDEVATENFLEQMKKGLFGSLTDLRQLITYEKLKGTLHDIIYSMEAAQIDFYPYQYKPVIKFINSPSERLLIADEVGLGKTIEAALIWMEMQARYQSKRLLVVCPKILADKWKAELRQKFLIDSKIVDHKGLTEEIDELARYGDAHSFALIATYSGLRPPSSARDILRRAPEEELSKNSKVALLQRMRFWHEDFSPLDLVIFDEAHYMRNSATATYLLGESLAASARGVLCVSATPVNNSNTDLHSLLRLIDEDFFATQSSFDDLLKSNRPTVAVANALAKNPIKPYELEKALERMSTFSYIKQSPYFQELVEKLLSLAETDFADKSLLAKCQDIIEKMNVLGSYVNRTRRVQVQEERPIRKAVIAQVNYTPEEMELYQTILNAVRTYCIKNNTEFHVFQIMTWQLLAASCLPAFVEKIKNQSNNNSNSILDEAFGLIEDIRSEENNLDEALIEKQSLLDYDYETNDSKFKELLTVLNDYSNEKIIVFSYYRGTLAYLAKRLRELGHSVALIHGGIKVEDRWKEIDDFSSPTGSRILLASEVGSEGIDLQFCRILVNYDLPWNPMRVEQRIGRIDRVGQEAKKLTIVNFKIYNTIEERIYERLHEKLEKFSSSLGDLDEVLGEEVKKLTIDLLSKNLTEEQENARIKQTENAIARKQEDIKNLEDAGEGLVALSDYVQRKIEEDRGKGRYIKPQELEKYVSSFFSKNFFGTTINYNTPQDGCMQITLSGQARASLLAFIKNDKTAIVQPLKQQTLTVTFDRAIAQKNRKKRYIFINHISPFIRWITKIKKDSAYTLHKISAVEINTQALAQGNYLFKIDKWILKGVSQKELLAYGFISMDTFEVVPFAESEAIFYQIFENGKDWTYRNISGKSLDHAFNKLEAYIESQFDGEAVDFERENANIYQIKSQRIKTIFGRKISDDNRRLHTLMDNKRDERVLNMTKTRIQKNELLLQNKLEELKKKTDVDYESEPVALGVINVINR